MDKPVHDRDRTSTAWEISILVAIVSGLILMRMLDSSEIALAVGAAAVVGGLFAVVFLLSTPDSPQKHFLLTHRCVRAVLSSGPIGPIVFFAAVWAYAAIATPETASPALLPLFLLFGVPITYAVLLFVGMPLLLVLRGFNRISKSSVMAAGAALAILTLLLVVARPGMGHYPPVSAYVAAALAGVLWAWVFWRLTFGKKAPNSGVQPTPVGAADAER